jgi:uncharacterized membrane protein
MEAKKEKTIGELAAEIKSIKLSSIGRVIRIAWKIICLAGIFLCGAVIITEIMYSYTHNFEFWIIMGGTFLGGLAFLVELASGLISAKIFRLISSVK